MNERRDEGNREQTNEYNKLTLNYTESYNQQLCYVALYTVVFCQDQFNVTFAFQERGTNDLVNFFAKEIVNVI